MKSYFDIIVESNDTEKELAKNTMNKLANCISQIKKGHEEFKDDAYTYASTLNEIYLNVKKDSRSYIEIKNLIINNDYETVFKYFKMFLFK